MYQTDLKLQTASGGFNPLLATELALRGAEQLYDINVSTARVFVQAQANTAAAFGVPDWSPLFDLATDQTRQILSAGAGQVLDAAQRASEVATELQRSAGQLLESQTAQAADNLQRGMEEFNAQASESLSQLSRAVGDATQAVQDGQEWMQDAVHDVARPDMPLNPISEAAHAVG
ncbi:MAG TPA: hypothetical protein H9903_11135 [Candidatus Aquabacterium excrementipullorum]|nr:hypothetical protein [Candidatus Aquabacterium excrementipullorum]